MIQQFLENGKESMIQINTNSYLKKEQIAKFMIIIIKNLNIESYYIYTIY